MRMNPMSGETAEQVVNHIDERELADVIYEFGEERRSRRIARAIVRSRPIRTTKQLVEVIAAAARSMNWKHERIRIHPATRTFQALRIFVNRELDDLKALLEAAPRVLKPGGRLVVISFHSLEDRIVKDALREGAQRGWYRLLTKKPVTAGAEEIERNPRSRSAKMRAAEKISSQFAGSQFSVGERLLGTRELRTEIGVPGKGFGRNSVVEFSRSGQEKTEQGRVRRRKAGIFEMKFTGTLIEDLMATVERVEKRARADRALVVNASALEPGVVEPAVVQPHAPSTLVHFRSGKRRLRFQIYWSGINHERLGHRKRSSFQPAQVLLAGDPGNLFSQDHR